MRFSTGAHSVKLAEPMKLSYAIALALLTTATASTAFGQEGAAGDDAKWKIVQRDPDGTKGVSPYEEELFNGRRAFAKGDHAGAIAGFDAAIGKDAERLAAYLLKAQVQIAKGDVDAAKATIETGKQKKGTAPERAKLLFLESDVAERKQAPAPEKPEAIDVLTKAWDTFKATWGAR